MIRPKITILDDDHKDKVLLEAKQILSRQGVQVQNKVAAEILKEEGLNHVESLFFIPPDLAEKCVKSVPNQIKLYDREGNEHFLLENDNVLFNPGSTAMNVIDENTGERRHAKTEDFIKFTQVVEKLKYIDAQSTAMVCQDVPIISQDWYRLFICLNYCYKPIITGTFNKDSFQIMKELLLTCRLSEKDLANKPLAIFDAAPSPPLIWTDLTTQAIIDGARSKIPIEFVSMPIAGANGPITLIGSITQMCAENLAGVVISQLTNKGAPLIWGGSPAVLDMRQGTSPMGSIEAMMMNIGNIEMGKYLKIPTHAYMCVSDSKMLDLQMAFEAGIGLILGALAGINVISGPGMLESESTQSISKLMIDNEIAGMVKKLIAGIPDHDLPFASDIIEDFRKKGNLLSHPSTLNLYKKELYFTSSIINRMSYSSWLNSGALSTRKRINEELKNLNAKPEIKPINEGLKRELSRIASESINITK